MEKLYRKGWTYRVIKIQSEIMMRFLFERKAEIKLVERERGQINKTTTTLQERTHERKQSVPRVHM